MSEPGEQDDEAVEAVEAESARTLIECPGCHRIKPPEPSMDHRQGSLYCYDCHLHGRVTYGGERRLICTVGLPRSGKSTWARATGFPIVNPDSIRFALHGRDWFPQAEPWVWSIAYTMVEALFRAGHKTVVLDATMVSQGRRQGWIERYGKDIVWKVFHTSPEVCHARAAALGQEDLHPVIDKMWNEWDFGQDVHTDRVRQALR